MVSAPVPRQVELFPNGEIGILWEDGREDFFTSQVLRQACPCAQCVDEISGKQLLLPSSIPATVRALEILQVGRYAVCFQWSDGHQTGIYSFEYLRHLAPERPR